MPGDQPILFRDFEIGDKTGAIAGASIGASTYTASTQLNIASASKWLFGAYESSGSDSIETIGLHSTATA